MNLDNIFSMVFLNLEGGEGGCMFYFCFFSCFIFFFFFDMINLLKKKFEK